MTMQGNALAGLAALTSMLTLLLGRVGDAAPITNLVSNPSLEEADPELPDRPLGFVPGFVGAESDAKLTWEPEALTGEKCVAVETLTSNALAYWETTVPVKPATEYVISFSYKCRSAGVPESTTGDPEYNTGRACGPNLELGVVADDPSEAAKPQHWTDIGIALGPVGGTYLPPATDWVSYRQRVTTVAGQTQMRLKLRMYCSAQKVWFDDLSVVEAASLPECEILSPRRDETIADGRPTFRWAGPEEIGTCLLEYSPSPSFPRGSTTLVEVQALQSVPAEALPAGPWFWRVGDRDRAGLACWLADGSFWVGDPVWVSTDTTPPAVFSPQPLPNANATPDATISARFEDGGSGVRPQSVRLRLDGKEVLGRPEVRPEGIAWRPEQPLRRGAHEVEVSVADNAGNVSNRLAWRFAVGESLTHELTVEGRRVFLNGRPYFPVGIYSYQCHPADGRFLESGLAQAAAAGFDVTLNTIETQEGLDKLFSHGIMCLLNVTADLAAADTPAVAEETLFREGQGQFRDHPSVLGFWSDDPENLDDAGSTPLPMLTREKLRTVRQALTRSAPDRRVAFAISNLPRLRDTMPFGDILLAYRYPVPHYHPQMIHGWTLAYCRSVIKDKPIWFNSQAIDLGYGEAVKSTEGFRPSPVEMRAMAYYSLVLGVEGYTAYANAISEEATPEHWAELLRMATEMRYLAPVLAAGQDAGTLFLVEDATCGAIHFREIEHEGVHTAIAVNMSGDSVVAWWELGEARKVRALFEDRETKASTTRMADVFAPFEVHVYRWPT